MKDIPCINGYKEYGTSMYGARTVLVNKNKKYSLNTDAQICLCGNALFKFVIVQDADSTRTLQYRSINKLDLIVNNAKRGRCMKSKILRHSRCSSGNVIFFFMLF